MAQLNPGPVFGAKKKYQYHLTGIFDRNFRTNCKRSVIQHNMHVTMLDFVPFQFVNKRKQIVYKKICLNGFQKSPWLYHICN